MNLFDTHCHIQSSQKLTGDGGEAATRARWERAGHPAAAEILARAAEHGVTRMVCVGCSLSDSELAVSFVQDHPQTWASIGIHSHEAKDVVVGGVIIGAQAEAFAALAGRRRVVAVGECGLDYYYEHSDPADQALVLRMQIELALTHDLPLIFHVREAFDDFWPIFDSYTGIRGVVHSFTDSIANMERAVAAGLYIGVNGIATFAQGSAQQEMYRRIPLNRLLLETDSPFLTPVPHRGSICEPYHTRVTAEHLAHMRGENLLELAAATTVNAQTLFDRVSNE